MKYYKEKAELGGRKGKINVVVVGAILDGEW